LLAGISMMFFTSKRKELERKNVEKEKLVKRKSGIYTLS
jgi:hypothetical protein